MDVSIIVPFYNQVGWLYEAINSINESDQLTFEILIIDDGSKEKIEMKKFNENQNNIKIIRQSNQGPGIARNRGIEDAQGEYIAFLDSDDLFEPNKLTKQINFMEKNKLYWCHSPYTRFYVDGNTELIDNSTFSGNVFPYCFAFNPIATPTVIAKKEVFNNPLNRFSETMRYGQDGFLWSRLAASYPLGVINESLSRVRMRGTNATLKAKNHLYAKSKMYQYMKQADIYYNGKDIPVFLKAVFSVANFNYNLIEKLFNNHLESNFVEVLSRVLYSSQYIALKLYKILLK